MTAPKRRNTPSPEGPFFAKQLAGENPLSGATARRIYDLSQRFHQQKPWQAIPGDLPIVLNGMDDEALAFATVLGSAGQTFGLKVYENGPARDFLLDVLAEGTVSIGAFLRDRQMLSLEFDFRGELDTQDKGLINAMGHHHKISLDNPRFRSGRPGYNDWYLTEEEGRRMAAYLEALLWLFEGRGKPAVEAVADEALAAGQWLWIRPSGESYEVLRTSAPSKGETPRERAPVIDIGTLENIKAFRAQQGNPVEVAYEVLPMGIGGKHERPLLAAVVILADAKSGFLFTPGMGTAKDPAAALAERALVSMVAAAKAFPREIHHDGTMPWLEALAKALGIPVQVRAELPAVAEAREALMGFLGGRG